MSAFEPNGANRRRHERKAAGLQAEIVRPCRPSVDCTVINLSVAGALVETSQPEWLPPVFKLIIKASNFQTFCEVRHREERRYGVAFIAAPEIATLIESAAETAFEGEEPQLSAREQLRLRLAAPGN